MEENLTVAAVARQIGVAPATLRTWDRRYGLGPSSHESGSHRRYCPADLARLVLMRRLITAGVAPSDAAVKAKSAKAPSKSVAVIPTYEVKADLAEAIYRAAVAFDKPFITKAIAKEIEKNGVITAWQEVIIPSLVMIGDVWEESGEALKSSTSSLKFSLGYFLISHPRLRNQ
jgi:DNA-binding transcriptional MerR regulator